MKKIIFTLITVILLAVAFGCTKDNAGNAVNVQADTSNASSKQVINQKIITDNQLLPLITISNPKSMKIDTKPLDAAQVDANRQKIEQAANKVVEYIAQNGIDATCIEISKGIEGAFKEFIPEPKAYLAFLKKKDDVVWTIVAHGTKSDFVGLEVNLDKWKDLTGWTYILDASKKMEAGESNQVWLKNIYWKDPAWANGKPSKFDAYNRLIKIDDALYHFYYNVWLDE